MGLNSGHKTDAKTAKAVDTVRAAWANLMNWIAKGHRKNPVCKG